MKTQQEITVVHLAWVPYGIDLFTRFIDSYLDYTAGCSHDLLIVFSGVENESQITRYLHYVNSRSISFRYYVRKDGQDIETYKWVAELSGLNSEVILYLNSFTRFNSHNWLKKYMDNLLPDIGMISASGSYQSYYSSVFLNQPIAWERNRGIRYNYRKYKLFLKALFYWRFLFNPFPNPHLRTNGFMIRRKDMLVIRIKLPLKNKFDAYLVENGRRSLTKQILGMGYRVGVIGKDGRLYDIGDWANSSIFWQSNQENLLILDNKTDEYDCANIDKKTKLHLLAWGK